MTSASVRKPNVKIKAVKGNHLPGLTNKDVKAILFQCTTIKYLPGNLGQMFPQLKIFWIKTCGLIVISPNDLDGLENLVEFNADYNKLKSLPDNLFSNMKKLKKISFYGNKLQYFSLNSLDSFMLHHMKSIDFRKNSAIDAIFDSKEPGGISLQHLMQLIDTQCAKPADKNELSREFFKVENSGSAASVKKCENNKTTVSTFSVEQFIEYFHNDHNATGFYEMAANVVSQLKGICEDLLLKDLNESNAYEMFLLGHLHSSENLKKKAIDEVKKMFPDRQINDGLIDDLDQFEELLDAHRKFKQKIREAQEEFDRAWQDVSKMSKLRKANNPNLL